MFWLTEDVFLIEDSMDPWEELLKPKSSVWSKEDGLKSLVRQFSIYLETLKPTLMLSNWI